jgi:hypothetical protein
MEKKKHKEEIKEKRQRAAWRDRRQKIERERQRGGEREHIEGRNWG